MFLLWKMKTHEMWKQHKYDLGVLATPVNIFSAFELRHILGNLIKLDNPIFIICPCIVRVSKHAPTSTHFR